ncbi:MAG: ROK family protein [Arachnia sp.]
MTTPQGPDQPLAGIDIGGTKISALLVTDDGRVLGRETVPTPAKEGGAVIADTASALVHALIERVGVAPRAAGVGAAGVIDAFGAVLAASDSFHNWVGFPLSDELAARLGVPTITLNDVNAFLLGEATWGSAHGEDVLGVMLGTGVGGAMLLGGTLRNGPNGGAGEIGHTARYSDIVCTCGRVGHLETVAAGRSIARAYLEATGREGVTTKDVADLARDGDPVALRLFERAGHALAQACVSAATLLDIPTIVVGGSVANAWDLMQPSIDQVLRDDPPVTGAPLTISRGSLGGDAVALGAAAALRQTLPAPLPEGTPAS